MKSNRKTVRPWARRALPLVAAIPLALAAIPLMGVNAPPVCAPAPAPPTAGALDGIAYDPAAWNPPRALTADINIEGAELGPGWEDSPNISADGTTLFFAYMRYDFGTWQMFQPPGSMSFIIDPNEPVRGQCYVFDIYEACIVDGEWVVLNSPVNYEQYTPNICPHAQGVGEASPTVNAARSVMVFTRFEDPNWDLYESKNNSDPNNYDSTAWTAPPVKLPGSDGPASNGLPDVNTNCQEDEAHLTAEGRHLYFRSTRGQWTGTEYNCSGPDKIYVTRRSNISSSDWEEAKEVGGSINSMVVAAQPFAAEDDSVICWAGVDSFAPPAQCSAGTVTLPGEIGQACIFCANRTSAPGAWPPVFGTEQLVLDLLNQEVPTDPNTVGKVVTLGEPSFTLDGKYLYFVYVEKEEEAPTSADAAVYDPSIGVIERK